jgi:carbon starvation protein
MSSLLLLLVGLAAFATGYRFYSRYLAERIFRLHPDFRTPAHQFHDGVDYVPTNRHVLFGHHFTSVAGAAPIVGPAIAVIWGWLPAFLWVVVGTVFAGAVHDFGALWISSRHKGQSMGTLTQGIIGSRARTLFLLIIFFLILMVNAVFAVVIANLFIANPGAVLPIWVEVPIAMAVGFLVYRTRAGILLPSVVSLLLLYAFVWIGQHVPLQLPDLFGFAPTQAQLEANGGDLVAAGAAAARDGVRAGWVILMLVYGLIASSLPVWMLLQPRDYINSHPLFVALAVIFAGILVLNPPIVAPAVNAALPADAPGWFPLLFITIACGAISGFHGLVASGTTSKQLDRESDARLVGYGGMRIWPLFGTTNQLTGGFTLLVVTLFLLALRRKAWVTAIPMVFLLVMTTWALTQQVAGYLGDRQWLLFGFGAAILVLELWLILEAVVALRSVLTRHRLPPSAYPAEKVTYDVVGTE